MFVKNGAGRDAVWEVEQRTNEELVTWLLAFGEEKVDGEVTEEDDEIDKEDVEEGASNPNSESERQKP